MRLLVDENIPRSIVNWLIESGHDVRWAAESLPGASDLTWATQAALNNQIILTNDKDFGELSYRDRVQCRGVILLRLDELNTRERLNRLIEVWPVIEEYSPNYFIVITSHKIRTRIINAPGSD
ncbi:MAG: DUF5615 family PIN-like protein [bacterium]